MTVADLYNFDMYNIKYMYHYIKTYNIEVYIFCGLAWKNVLPSEGDDGKPRLRRELSVSSSLTLTDDVSGAQHKIMCRK